MSSLPHLQLLWNRGGHWQVPLQELFLDSTKPPLWKHGQEKGMQVVQSICLKLLKYVSCHIYKCLKDCLYKCSLRTGYWIGYYEGSRPQGIWGFSLWPFTKQCAETGGECLDSDNTALTSYHLPLTHACSLEGKKANSKNATHSFFCFVLFWDFCLWKRWQIEAHKPKSHSFQVAASYITCDRSFDHVKFRFNRQNVTFIHKSTIGHLSLWWFLGQLCHPFNNNKKKTGIDCSGQSGVVDDIHSIPVKKHTYTHTGAWSTGAPYGNT